MDSGANVEVVKKLYANFGQGNIEGILAGLTDDVRWEESPHAEIPYAGARKGKAAVKEFFAGVAQVEVASFEPKEYFSTGDHVFVVGSWSGRAKPTGKSFKSDWVMHWTLRGGKVTYFRSYEDSAAVAVAFKK